MTGSPILIMAGGTGGHVFPALVVAEALLKLDRKVVWLGTSKGIENQLVPRLGIQLERIRITGLRRKGILNWLTSPVKILFAVFDALLVLIRCRPSVVIGMGGFASGPGGFVAWLLRYPLIIHEQNAAAGLTNRMLAGFSRDVLQAFPGSFSGVEAQTVGNPVRAKILALSTPDERFEDRKNQEETLRILVLGGSQGAKAINQIFPDAAEMLSKDKKVEIWHQTGSKTYLETIALYAQKNIEANVHEFIEDMAEAYAWADVVISRSGAMTVSELTAVGIGSLLIPYPESVDDHQTLNAKFLCDAGAAVLIQQKDLTPVRLAKELNLCTNDRNLLLARANCARNLSLSDATDKVVAACLALEKIK
ncbi:MAG: undecaprenyldiphospho-muramoylpentapeptide beta-N-acetylglucosaminyltransferase [Pseudomonadota bacterium]|nr:undecaprenyldiphospho-muramoylpentapeptide beta-N-acetylglucosaminyltransferase [Pseudomonadota bacterium]